MIREIVHKSEDLKLLKLLRSYAEGTASWRSFPLTNEEKKDCERLLVNLIHILDECFSPLLDRVTSREMSTFTSHDRYHAMKVADIMFAITNPEKQSRLTPPEIGLLTLSAFLHDLGMGLSSSERETRLSKESDLWLKSDITSIYRDAIQSLRNASATDEALSEAARRLHQAEEAVLCLDSRERHATPERYRELLSEIRALSAGSKRRVADPDSAFLYAGDSLEEDLINICVSHNQNAAFISSRPAGKPTFPRDAPFGTSTADTQYVAACLRLADILDFDRERTPEVLFQYLIPKEPADRNVSVREWEKHIAVVNWSMDSGALEYLCVCDDPVIHHALILFSEEIKSEIARTRASLSPSWDFVLNGAVEMRIREIGYTYYPFKFKLDEERVYSLLMGTRLYGDRLAFIRELLQNASDACSLRDATMQLHDIGYTPSRNSRITVDVRKSNKTAESTLSITDNGIGMDLDDIKKYFLTVGNSYYRSSNFLRLSATFASRGIKHASVSEFGIGFLSSFLVADTIEVETTKWPTNEQLTRNLHIDGVGRLIHVLEKPASPYGGGTAITLNIKPSMRKHLGWSEILNYIQATCINLPFDISCRYFIDGEISEETVVEAKSVSFPVPEDLSASAYVIDIDDDDVVGRVVLFSEQETVSLRAKEADQQPIAREDKPDPAFSDLVRGGFRVSKVPGVPAPFIYGQAPMARLFVPSGSSIWDTNVARNGLADASDAESYVQRLVLEKIFSDPHLPNLGRHEVSPTLADAKWLQRWSALDIYEIAKRLWSFDSAQVQKILDWESGNGSVYRGYGDKVWHTVLTDIVLPRVTTRTMNGDGNYLIDPPCTGWRDILREWRTFIDEPVRWSRFCNYSTSIDRHIFYLYAGSDCLNVRFRDTIEMTDISSDEWCSVFTEIIRARQIGRQAKVLPHQVAAIEKLVSQYDGASVASVHGPVLLKRIIDAV